MPDDDPGASEGVVTWPVTALQSAMLRASERHPAAGFYLVQDVCRTVEELDFGVLRRAWAEVCRRHGALRLRFRLASTLSSVVDDLDLEWSEFDWRGLDACTVDERLEGFLAADRERGFDFEAGVPSRVAAIRLPAEASACQ